MDVGGLRAVQDYFQESTEHVCLGPRRQDEKSNLVSLPSFLNNEDDSFRRKCVHPRAGRVRKDEGSLSK